MTATLGLESEPEPEWAPAGNRVRSTVELEAPEKEGKEEKDTSAYVEGQHAPPPELRRQATFEANGLRWSSAFDSGNLAAVRR